MLEYMLEVMNINEDMKSQLKMGKQVAKYNKKYDPPYSAKQVKEKYGEALYKKLAADPAHKFRMDTGIELIHKEPTLQELVRIGENWILMNREMKVISDKKSIELYGMTNEEHYKLLIQQYQ